MMLNIPCQSIILFAAIISELQLVGRVTIGTFNSMTCVVFQEPLQAKLQVFSSKLIGKVTCMFSQEVHVGP